MIFRIRHQPPAGDHVHCRLFSGPHEGALAKCGDLVMRSTEFNAFREAATFVQFVADERSAEPRRLVEECD